MRRMADLLAERSQFVIATHSPILMAFPGATIYECGPEGLERVAYDDLDHVRLTRSFLEDPQRFLRHLFDDDCPFALEERVDDLALPFALDVLVSTRCASLRMPRRSSTRADAVLRASRRPKTRCDLRSSKASARSAPAASVA